MWWSPKSNFVFLLWSLILWLNFKICKNRINVVEQKDRLLAVGAKNKYKNFQGWQGMWLSVQWFKKKIQVLRKRKYLLTVTVLYAINSLAYKVFLHLWTISQLLKEYYSQTCIWRPLNRTWKCGIYKQLPFIYRIKLYSLINNGKNEAAL